MKYLVTLSLVVNPSRDSELEKTAVTLAEVLEYLPKETSLHYVDGSDGFTPEQLFEAFKEKEWYPLAEVIMEWETFEAEQGYLAELKRDCECLFVSAEDEDETDFEALETWFDEHEDEIREEIQERNTSTPIDDLLRNSENLRLRVTLGSNYESLGYELQEVVTMEGYFGDLVNALRLNPKEVKALLLANGYEVAGNWPNKPKRLPIIALDKQFLSEIVNNLSRCSQFVLLVSIDIKKWIESEGKTVTVYKGTECGFFDSWTGSGSCIECETIRDFKISLPEHPLSKTDKYFQWTTTADEKCGNGYSTADVFGSGCFNHEEVTI